MSGPSNVTLNPGSGGASIGADQDPSGTTWEVERAAFGPSGQVPQLVAPGTPMPTAETGDLRTAALASLGSTSTDDQFNQRTVLDCLDVTSETYVALPVAPMGLELPGQAPAARSVPVALANEDIQDLYVAGGMLGTGNLNINALTGTYASIDLIQYRSVSLQVNTFNSGTVTITFEGSNDNQNFVTAPLYDAAAPTGAPITATAVAANTFRFFSGPTPFRYFRARISTAVATGHAQALARFSMAPWSAVYTQIASSSGQNVSVGLSNINGSTLATSATGTPSVGVTYMGTAAVISAGIAGTLAVGGNLADGSTPTLNGVRTAGIDPQGLLRTLRTDAQGNVAVQQDPTTAGSPSLNDILLQVLGQLKVLTHYTRELAGALNSGQSLQDDEAAMLADPTLFN